LTWGDGAFVDETYHFGLADPSLGTLGFGTQFLDADLDGRPDLLVVNGHFDDLSDQGIPFRMKPQFFHHRGEGFAPVGANILGRWFEGDYLGRGMARIDWIRDGLEDAVVTRLHDPATLLTNQTESAGRFLAVHLRAVQAARDAIGTTVAVTTSQGRRSRQLIVGDGYR
jgi:hypothetical protein